MANDFIEPIDKTCQEKDLEKQVKKLGKQLRSNNISNHKAKVLTKKEVEKGRSNAYKYIIINYENSN